ncbi:unnamed protein product [Linum trigynum]|uniref:Uncharacterized protein n=1 Tax=Linum trigynum TaxID=586398 RepID=A0AAV2CRI1_9ROSI
MEARPAGLGVSSCKGTVVGAPSVYSLPGKAHAGPRDLAHFTFRTCHVRPQMWTSTWKGGGRSAMSITMVKRKSLSLRVAFSSVVCHIISLQTTTAYAADTSDPCTPALSPSTGADVHVVFLPFKFTS